MRLSIPSFRLGLLPSFFSSTAHFAYRRSARRWMQRLVASFYLNLSGVQRLSCWILDIVIFKICSMEVNNLLLSVISCQSCFRKKALDGGMIQKHIAFRISQKVSAHIWISLSLIYFLLLFQLRKTPDLFALRKNVAESDITEIEDLHANIIGQDSVMIGPIFYNQVGFSFAIELPNTAHQIFPIV